MLAAMYRQRPKPNLQVMTSKLRSTAACIAPDWACMCDDNTLYMLVRIFASDAQPGYGPTRTCRCGQARICSVSGMASCYARRRAMPRATCVPFASINSSVLWAPLLWCQYRKWPYGNDSIADIRGAQDYDIRTSTGSELSKNSFRKVYAVLPTSAPVLCTE